MSETRKNQAQAHGGSGFAGTLRNIQLNDIIQMCCLAGASICVRVRQDQEQGILYIQEGDIVHAECGSITGVQAFFTIMGWPSGQFETLDAPLVTRPTIKEPYQFLLMEAARKADEQAQGSSEKSRPEPAVQKRLRVLIVDDSAIMSKIVTSMLMADPTIEVIDNAKNGEEALEKMRQLSPDLITMDVNMPVMGGSTALKHIMIESPCPVVIMSNLGPTSYATILSFLNLGAVDFMSKPVKNHNIVTQQQRMVDRVHLAVKTNMKRFQRLRLPKRTPSDFLPINERLKSERFVIMVSGVGGYLEMVHAITSLPPAPTACVLSMQSIPPQFSPALADYLNLRSRFEVHPLADGAVLCPGRCYIGASRRSIEIVVETFVPVLKDSTQEAWDEDASGVDHLFSRAADLFKDRMVVLLLSGGEYGTMEGLRRIKAARGRIIAPQLEKCILPATIEPVMKEDLITEMFDPKDMMHVLKRYCT
ncbi:MAG: response regulator [Desulfobacteraceae bacterium]|nr:MAG: response regulator [Desulfobacteraceae bacterium]